MVLEGILRVHWSVNCLIHLKQEDNGDGGGVVGGDGGGGVVGGKVQAAVATLQKDNSNGPMSDSSDSGVSQQKNVLIYLL